MTDMRAVSLPLMFALAGIACSHPQYRYELKPAEERALDATISSFVRGAGEIRDPAAVTQRVDVRGRMALLDLFRHSLFRRDKLEARGRDLLTLSMLVMRGTEQSGRAFTEPELKTAMFGALDALEGSLAQELKLEPADLKVMAVVLGVVPKPPTEAARVEAVSEALGTLELKECQTAGPRFNYRAEIFSRIDEPKSEHWARWRRNLESLHLLTLYCEGKRGAVLLSRHKGEDSPRIVAWQFFDPDDWQVIEPRLLELLNETR
jgi:alkylhydroperoxidase/carboxymuconolactone decarboxylase family protein YurZ